MNLSTIALAEEMRSSVSFAQSLVCPKPRRLAFLNQTLGARSRICCYNYQADLPDSNVGSELMDIIFSNSKGGEGSSNKVSSSPPFFCGSPPSRVSNPLIQDAQFRDSRVVAPVSACQTPLPHPTPLSGLTPSPNSASKGSGCVRGNFGNNPAVRVEGFDCLDRDRRNCSIPAQA